MQYLMAVYGPAELTEFGNYPDKASMEQAYADTGAFNEKLQAGGHFVFAQRARLGDHRHRRRRYGRVPRS